ncbi:response regulator transcription factor [Candidatus Frankia nodulisporulans]|uniref:response regulator transcription factor n=1 Tax=Candidatus Frankia nodulisporulans TaxID=2060052 RepID=UPI0013D5A851|nr:response regulator transcription factor [Candidatus Frankia nodulisporulans]
MSDDRQQARRLRLLLINEDTIDAALLREALRDRGRDWDLHVCPDSRRAFDFPWGLSTPPDAILLDLHAPGAADGRLLARAQADLDTQGIPTIALTAPGMVEVSHDPQNPMIFFVAKPDDFDGFLDLVRRIEDLRLAPEPSHGPHISAEPGREKRCDGRGHD